MGGIHEVCHRDGLRCHDIYKAWFGHLKIGRGESQTHRQHGDLISLLLFFKNNESWLKTAQRHVTLAHTIPEALKSGITRNNNHQHIPFSASLLEFNISLN
jgi:hypothetical protein